MTIRLFNLGLLPPSARKARALAAVCRRVLRQKGADGEGELNIVFLDRRRMRGLNQRFLGHAGDTDVIAFRYAQDPGPRPWERPFGDIFISAHQARTQATELGHGVLTEVLVLVAHGSLHLIGYDDRTARGRAIMDRLQQKSLPRKGVRLSRISRI